MSARQADQACDSFMYSGFDIVVIFDRWSGGTRRANCIVATAKKSMFTVFVVSLSSVFELARVFKECTTAIKWNLLCGMGSKRSECRIITDCNWHSSQAWPVTSLLRFDLCIYSIMILFSTPAVCELAFWNRSMLSLQIRKWEVHTRWSVVLSVFNWHLIVVIHVATLGTLVILQNVALIMRFLLEHEVRQIRTASRIKWKLTIPTSRCIEMDRKVAWKKIHRAVTCTFDSSLRLSVSAVWWLYVCLSGTFGMALLHCSRYQQIRSKVAVV